MQPLVDAHNVTVVGAWNRRIFNPAWVAEHLSSDGEVRLEVAVENPTLPVRLSFDGVRLRLGPDRVIISSEAINPAGQADVERVVRRILELLPHTPVQAIGVNFGWREPDPGEDLLGIFDVSDNQRLADAGATIQSTEVKRSTVYEENALNLQVTLDENAVITFNLNFHKQVSNAEEALEHLASGIAHFRAKAATLLNTTYNTDLDA